MPSYAEDAVLPPPDPITVARVERWVEGIRAAADDSRGLSNPEFAHSEEDALYQAVLRAVAAGHPDSVALAAEALKSRDVDFPRWMA